MLDHGSVDLDELVGAERQLWEAFPHRGLVDLSEAQDRKIRSDVLRALLLGAQPPAAGHLAALVLVGAEVTGVLDLSYSTVSFPARMARCVFEHPIELVGTSISVLNLSGSSVPGLHAPYATVAGNLELDAMDLGGRVDLRGARIKGILNLNDTTITADGQALLGRRLQVEHDITARRLRTTGEVFLSDSKVDGCVFLEGAFLGSTFGRSLTARGATVGALMNCSDGFTADGQISLTGAVIRNGLSFYDSQLSNAQTKALTCRNLRTSRLQLLPKTPIGGELDLRHANIDVIEDAPSTWPSRIKLDGLIYRSFDSEAGLLERINWLGRDPSGHRSQPYEHLASVLRNSGRSDAARRVLLTAERRARAGRGASARAWGYVQDALLGYGYLPARAAGWFVGFAIAGWLFFSAFPPEPGRDATPKSFVAFVYACDLLLPVVNLRQEALYRPTGAGAWVATLLIVMGWVLTTTVAVALGRVLRRP